MNVMRSMAHRLERLFEKRQVLYAYVAKMMPHGFPEEPKQAAGAHRLLARGFHVELAPGLAEDGQGAVLSS